MEKRVVIINGKGGVGKDTLCNIIGKKYAVKNISSITYLCPHIQNKYALL